MEFLFCLSVSSAGCIDLLTVWKLSERSLETTDPVPKKNQIQFYLHWPCRNLHSHDLKLSDYLQVHVTY